MSCESCTVGTQSYHTLDTTLQEGWLLTSSNRGKDVGPVCALVTGGMVVVNVIGAAIATVIIDSAVTAVVMGSTIAAFAIGSAIATVVIGGAVAALVIGSAIALANTGSISCAIVITVLSKAITPRVSAHYHIFIFGKFETYISLLPPGQAWHTHATTIRSIATNMLVCAGAVVFFLKTHFVCYLGYCSTVRIPFDIQ